MAFFILWCSVQLAAKFGVCLTVFAYPGISADLNITYKADRALWHVYKIFLVERVEN
jgi:hypothetical protein